MAFISVGQLTLNPQTNISAQFPSAAGRRARGSFFLLDVLTPAALVEDTYFLVIPNVLTNVGLVELGLRVKYFPKGRPILFSVAIPPGETFNPTEIVIEVIAKNRFRKGGDTLDITLELFIDQDNESNSIAAPIW